MSARSYGPIPLGIFEDEAFVELGWEARGVLLSILAVCCYHGRFPGSPALLARAVAAPDGGTPLEDILLELEAAKWIRRYRGTNARGRSITVGEVLGYHELAGLPRDRRNKRPDVPEWPDPDPLPAGSPDAPRSLPGDSPPAPRSLPAGSPLVKREERERRAQAREGAREAENVPVEQDPPSVEKLHTERALQAQQAWLDEYRRRTIDACGERRGRRGHGFFGSDGLDTLERSTAELVERDPRVAAVTLSAFWGEVDASSGVEGAVPSRLEEALQRSAVEHGLPNALAGLIAEVAS